MERSQNNEFQTISGALFSFQSLRIGIIWYYFFYVLVLQSSTVLAEDNKSTTEGKGPAKSLFSADFQGAPTYIRADEMTLFAEERRVLYKDKVEVLHEDMRLTSDELEAFYTPANEIDRIIAKDNVFITRETGTQARSEMAVYEKSSEIITLTINPEIQENGSIITADTIRIFLLEDRSEAEGEVRVKLVQPSSSSSSSNKSFSPLEGTTRTSAKKKDGGRRR